MKHILFPVAILMCGCSMYARETSKLELDQLRKEIPVRVTITTEGAWLGAYQIALIYNPEIVQVLRVDRGPEEDFSGIPVYDDKAFKTGRTPIASFVVKQWDKAPKSNSYRVLTVYFKPVGAGIARLVVEVQVLADRDGKRIDGTVQLTPHAFDTSELR